MTRPVMSHKKKFKIHGPPDRKHQPHPPTVPPDLVPPGIPRRTWNYDSIPRGRTQFLFVAIIAVVMGAVLIVSKEAPWQVCLPLVIIIVILGLLLFLFSKNR
jgi:hypothetical protein